MTELSDIVDSLTPAELLDVAREVAARQPQALDAAILANVTFAARVTAGAMPTAIVATAT